MPKKSSFLPDDPPLEATPEDVKAQLDRGDGITVSPNNTGDDRDIGAPTQPVDLPPEEDPAAADVLGRLTAAMEALAKRDAATGPNDQIAAAMTMMAQAIERMTEGQMKGSQLVADATKRAQRPSNEVTPMISAFNLRGDKDFPKPQPKCDFQIPNMGDWDSVTREEAELVNLLEQGEYSIKRNDNTRIKIRVIVETALDSDKPTRLSVYHDTAFNNDNKDLLPAFDVWLRQALLSKPRTKQACLSVLTMEEESALIMAGKFNNGELAPKGQPVVSMGA